jgi:KaiC/GvpD/RAD55 family RecA-like ATPase
MVALANRQSSTMHGHSFPATTHPPMAHATTTVKERTLTIPSGIGPIDEHLGGLMPGRTYVLSGAPGTGKSVACLQFLAAALKAGERAAILTQDDPEDLLSQSDFLELDLASAITSERLYLLRFQLDFARRFSRAHSPDEAFAELRTLLGKDAPTRLVIDSVVPFIDGGGSSASSAIAMLQLLDELGSTSLVTYPGDLAAVYDRRLDPLTQRAAAIFHLSADRQRHRQIEIRKVRYRVASASPIPYRIEGAAGFISIAEELRWQNDSRQPASERQRVVIDLPTGNAGEALRLLQSQYDVTVMGGTPRDETPDFTMPAVPARRTTDFSGNEKLPAPAVVQPTRNGVRVPFEAASFRAALLDIEAKDPRVFFAVIAVTAPPGQLEAFAGVALETIRAINGDLVAKSANQVLIYLHGTGRKHAPLFVQRLRDNWEQAGQGELIVDVLAYPADQVRLRTLLDSTV